MSSEQSVAIPLDTPAELRRTLEVMQETIRSLQARVSELENNNEG